MRRIAYLTGTRADFGLMVSTLRRLQAMPGVEVSTFVTGMHLSAAYGDTVREVEASGLPIAASVPVNIDERTPEAMANAIGDTVQGLTRALAVHRPDLLLLLGDRGEMLAGAIAALHLGIPIAHLHGGERSGTVDEPVRHAITKLSHLHLVASEESRDRVIRMGELPEHVHVVGAPGLDEIVGRKPSAREALLHRLGLPAGARYALVLFHPVVQEAGDAGAQTRALLQAVRDEVLSQGLHAVWLAPNADAGSGAIVQEMQRATGDRLHCLTHVPRADYLDALEGAELLAGNSSSGIIEAASFGTPVVNVGTRQRLRQRNANTIDCGTDTAQIAAALREAVGHGRYSRENVYGDGRAGERIAELLGTHPLPRSLLDKTNAY
ncbi:UDP-N-acetylglucosamine 2-epimerase [Ramlibacter henchirensis]|nr:UDP-N-acetylglucosamine 2-epimerase [Ramlibacter henchirensis]